MYRLVFSAIALPALLLAACETSEAGPASPAASVTPVATATLTATATRQPAAAPALVLSGGPIQPLPPEIAKTEVIIVQPTRPSVPVGPLTIATLDSSRKLPITPEGVEAWFAGIDGPLAYYVSWDSDSERSLWRIHTTTGEREMLLEYSGRAYRQGEAELSPDGRYLAFSRVEGVDVLNLATGERWRVATSAWDFCETHAVKCYGYDTPRWSRDGRLLLLRKGFYEGAKTIVWDPWEEPPVEYTYDLEDPGPSSGEWSPYGDSFCASGPYAAASPLYIGEPPNWRPETVTEAYEAEDLQDPDNSMRAFNVIATVDCAWVGSTKVAHLDYAEAYSAEGVGTGKKWLSVSVHSTVTGLPENVATETPGAYLSAIDLVALPGGERLIAHYFVEPSGDEPFELGRPLLIDAASGYGPATPILNAGDLVVAGVPSPGVFPDTGGPPPLPTTP